MREETNKMPYGMQSGKCPINNPSDWNCGCSSRDVCRTTKYDTVFTLVSYEWEGERNIALLPDDFQAYWWTIQIDDAKPIDTSSDTMYQYDAFISLDDTNFVYSYVTS